MTKKKSDGLDYSNMDIPDFNLPLYSLENEETLLSFAKSIDGRLESEFPLERCKDQSKVIGKTLEMVAREEPGKKYWIESLFFDQTAMKRRLSSIVGASVVVEAIANGWNVEETGNEDLAEEIERMRYAHQSEWQEFYKNEAERLVKKKKDVNKFISSVWARMTPLYALERDNKIGLVAYCAVVNADGVMDKGKPSGEVKHSQVIGLSVASRLDFYYTPRLIDRLGIISMRKEMKELLE